MQIKHNPAKIFLMGAGPGDPGLITVKALEGIKKADVILYDRLISKDILKYCKPGAVLEYVGKEKGGSVDQGRINEALLSYALKGKTVVRLKGGDPFIFGRGQEEVFFLSHHGIDCEVVPGVSSCTAVPEVCGIPLTYRGIASQFLVLTGHEDPAKKNEPIDWRRVAQFQGTIVIMMGLSNLKDITRKLIANGKDTKTAVAVIANGTTQKEKTAVARLSTIADKVKNFQAPAICVIGDVVKIAYQLNPKLKPLARKRYLTTASDTLNVDMAKSLKRLGASVVCLPMVRIAPNKDTEVLDQVIAKVKSFDWLVFTSRHGVYYFLKRYAALGANAADLDGRIACVGPGTAAEFTKHGITAALMPPGKFTTKDLARTLAAQGIAGNRVALLRTTLQRDELKKILVKAGAKITDCTVYTVEPRPYSKSHLSTVAKKTDGIFFLSPKSVQVFFNSIPSDLRQRLKAKNTFYSIGPVTTRMLKKFGLKKILSAKEHTVEGLVQLCLEDGT